VLKVLIKRGDLPMSEVGRNVHVSKSNMTSLIDKLVEKELVKRVPDEKDRRVINIAITDKGKGLLWNWKKRYNNEIKKDLSALSDEDLEKFYQSVENIKYVLSKLEND